MLKNMWLFLFVSLLVACGGGGTTSDSGISTVDISPLNGEDGVDGTSFISLIVPIVCEDGQSGLDYQTGPDNNPQNTKLDSVEVTSHASICPPPAPVGWGLKISYLKSSASLCGGDPSRGMALETWKDNNGNGKLDGNEVVANSLQWCNGNNGSTGATGAVGPQGNTGATGKNGTNGLTPIFNTEKFHNSDGQSCSRLSIGYDTVYKNGKLDIGTDEVKASSTSCEDYDTPTPNVGIIFTHTFGVVLRNPKHFKFVVTKTNPVNEFPLENPEISGITYIRITGIFNRPRPDGVVTIHFLKSQLQCLVGDQDPRHIGKDTYTVICSAYGAYIPANENVKAVWQIGPRRNSFELKKVEVFGVIPTTTN